MIESAYCKRNINDVEYIPALSFKENNVRKDVFINNYYRILYDG